MSGYIGLIDFEIQPALFNEAEWSQTQDEDTLERYIGRALTALKNVGVVANGLFARRGADVLWRRPKRRSQGDAS